MQGIPSSSGATVSFDMYGSGLPPSPWQKESHE